MTSQRHLVGAGMGWKGDGQVLAGYSDNPQFSNRLSPTFNTSKLDKPAEILLVDADAVI